MKSIISILFASTFLASSCQNTNSSSSYNSSQNQNTQNFYDYNSTEVGYSKHSISINNDINVNKYSSEFSNYEVQNVVRAVFSISVNGTEVFIQEENVPEIINQLNQVYSNENEMYKFSKVSKWLNWEERPTGAEASNSLDPFLKMHSFNKESNSFNLESYESPNKNHASQKPRDDETLRQLKELGYNLDETIMVAPIAANLIKNASIMMKNRLDRKNEQYSKFQHIPFWVLKLINSGFTESEYIQSTVWINRLNNSSSVLNNVSITNEELSAITTALRSL